MTVGVNRGHRGLRGIVEQGPEQNPPGKDAPGLAHDGETGALPEEAPRTGSALVPSPGTDLAGPERSALGQPAFMPWPGSSLATPPSLPDPARPGPTSQVRSSHRRRLVTASALAAALVVGVGVGAVAFGADGSGGSSNNSAGGSTSQPATGSLAAAANNSAAGSSASFSISATSTSPGTTTTWLTGSGAFDLRKDVGEATVSLPKLSSLTDGVVGTGTSGDVSLVVSAQHLYLKIPVVSTLLGGDQWIETSLPSGQDSSGTGSSGGDTSLGWLADPGDLLNALEMSGAPVSVSHNVNLDGQSTTKYQTTISLGSLAHQAHPGGTAGLKHLGGVTVPVVVWVGSDNLLRQISVTLDTSHANLGGLFSMISGVPSSGTGSTVTVTVGLSHYGQGVSVSVPPASQVTNLNSVLHSFSGIIPGLGNSGAGGAAGTTGNSGNASEGNSGTAPSGSGTLTNYGRDVASTVSEVWHQLVKTVAQRF